MDFTVNGICGWELNNPDPELFETRISKTFAIGREPEIQDKCPGFCGSCEFVNECLAPIQFRCLIPKNCEVVELACELLSDGVKVTYFSLTREGKQSFFQLTEPDRYWAKVLSVAEEQLPDWALSRLGV